MVEGSCVVGAWETDTCLTQASCSQHGYLDLGILKNDVNGLLPQLISSKGSD